MKDFNQALYALCQSVEGFRWVSRDIIIPQSKRRERLKKIAEELYKANEDFLEVVNDGRTDESAGR